MNKIKYLILSFFIIPVFTFAATFSEFVNSVYSKFIPTLFSILISLGFVFFAINVFIFVTSDSDKKAQIKDRLFLSTVAIFLLVSFWGIISILQNTFPSLKKGQESFHFKIEKNNIFNQKY